MSTASKKNASNVQVLSSKAQRLADLHAMKKVISANSVFHANLEETMQKILAEKEESRHQQVMNQIDKEYRFEKLGKYKVSTIFMDQEFVRVFESRAALNAFMKKLTVDVNLTVTVTSRSIYVA